MIKAGCAIVVTVSLGCDTKLHCSRSIHTLTFQVNGKNNGGSKLIRYHSSYLIAINK